MRQSYLLTIFLTLFLCSSAAAQQSVLVVHDDKNDPCRRFKMQILKPVGVASFKPLMKRPVDGVDYKMRVWNPCQQDEPQLVLHTPSPTTPDRGEFIFTPEPSKVRFQFFEYKERKLLDFLQTEPPSLFNIIGRGN